MNNPIVNQSAQRVVLPLIQHKGQLVIPNNKGASTQAFIQVKPPQWVQTPPPAGVQWLATLGAGFALLTGSVGLIKSRMDIQAQQYKALLEGNDQGPLKQLKEITERSIEKEHEPYDRETLNTLEVQEASAKPTVP